MTTDTKSEQRDVGALKRFRSDLDALEPRIAGDKLDGSISDFVRSCHVLVGEEQRKANPDNAVIGALCNAVRFAREHLYLVEKYIGDPHGDESRAMHYRECAEIANGMREESADARDVRDRILQAIDR